MSNLKIEKFSLSLSRLHELPLISRWMIPGFLFYSYFVCLIIHCYNMSNCDQALSFLVRFTIQSNFYVLSRSSKQALGDLCVIRNIHTSCSSANNNMTKIISTIDDRIRRWKVRVWCKKMYKCKLFDYFLFFFSYWIFNERINTFLLRLFVLYNICRHRTQELIKKKN